MKKLLVTMMTLTVVTSVWADDCNSKAQADCTKVKTQDKCNWKEAVGGEAATCSPVVAPTASTAAQPCELAVTAGTVTTPKGGTPVPSAQPAAPKDGKGAGI